MRFVSRLHACAALAFLTILYFTWLRSNDIGTTVHTWRGSVHRIVLGCDTIDNFAHSVPDAVGGVQTGALVDAGVHAEAKGAKSNNSAVLPFDFKTQVEYFITYNKGRRIIPQRFRKMDQWTYFTVFFGLWDLLEYSGVEKRIGMAAIEKSIDALFRELDILAQHTIFPPKVIIPKMIDVTFLPVFQSRKKALREAAFAEAQHQLVFLHSYWNTVLVQAASRWKNGTIYMPEPNELIMQEVRVQQLYMRQISDAAGVGKQAPLFEYVEQPCLASQRSNAIALQVADIHKCSAPAKHLFWDDIQLSGPAHELIGKQAALLVRGNLSVDVQQGLRASDKGKKADIEEERRFKLEFPPGY
ncbi:hypothetical protein PTNB85_01824 [Pyrenophora teres f. teres]|nr:hypothetical protein HRS9139_00410 [Pyrenophora teres f. teres]KAE8847981.1 hypothetical protein PTNB85_01824 [Pyrenophora teres f. teres]KAE8853858.1 hypothetical protein HRS9122_00850 [Pyrenophora teres f. teres]KAE8867907.1 hypothetical protein PTNB29_01818 [Pyrenophora teres f. teres]